MESFEVPVQVGEKIIRAMGLDAFSILNPENQKKYLTVARYLGKFEDGTKIAQLVSNGTPSVDKAEKLLEYVILRKELDEVRKKLSEMPSEDLVSAEDQEVAAEREALAGTESFLIQEISQYE